MFIISYIIKRKCIWLILIVIYCFLMSHWWTIICNVRLASLYGNILCNVIVSVEENEDEFKCLICNGIVYSTPIFFQLLSTNGYVVLYFNRTCILHSWEHVRDFHLLPLGLVLIQLPLIRTVTHICTSEAQLYYCFMYQPLISTMARICSFWLAGHSFRSNLWYSLLLSRVLLSEMSVAVAF